MHWKMSVVAFSATLVLAASAAAQMADRALEKITMSSMDAAPIKGAPFCANIVTEHTENLSDGNRIHTTDNSTLCRDSEGRTRREVGLNLLGAASQTSSPKLITIADPVARVRYVLDTENKVAQKMPLRPEKGPDTAVAPGTPGKGGQIMVYQQSGGSGSDVTFDKMTVNKSGPDSGEPDPASENLGDQTINGIHATGTRVTTTIPAGKMGNEKPIIVTSERWYSSELKATVMTKHDDPWAGELKTEFTSVNTAEPDSSLFTVPADYKIVDVKDGAMTIKLIPPGSGAK